MLAVRQISADAIEAPTPNTAPAPSPAASSPRRARFSGAVDLKNQHLETDGRRYPLAPGMKVGAEIKLGQRTVLEYGRRCVLRARTTKQAPTNGIGDQMSTFGKVIAGVALGPIMVLAAGIGGCEAIKAYYDWQVRGMCEKDGGTTVFEHVRISSAAASQMPHANGRLSVASESLSKPNDAAFARSESKVLREGWPRIERLEHTIVRRHDGRSVGRVVSYFRRGGDFPLTVSHESSYLCPGDLDVSKIFIVE